LRRSPICGSDFGTQTPGNTGSFPHTAKVSGRGECVADAPVGANQSLCGNSLLTGKRTGISRQKSGLRRCQS
jgi:hypothetical protein